MVQRRVKAGRGPRRRKKPGLHVKPCFTVNISNLKKFLMKLVIDFLKKRV